MTVANDVLAQRSCPSCGGSGSPAVSAPRAAEGLGQEELSQSWSGFFKERAFFTYHRCTGCGLLFNPTYFSGAAVGTMYAQMSDNTAGQPEAMMRATQAGYFNILRRHRAIAGSYAEIGPDIGLFTGMCASGGSVKIFHLFEPNQAVHARLEASTAGATCRIYTSLDALSQVPDHSLEIVVMIHVLDHLLDPCGFMAALRVKCAPSCKVLIVTHNEASLLARVLGTRWPAYCLQHPQLFNRASITALLRASGFQVDDIRRTTNHFPLLYLLKHGLWAFGLRVPIPGWTFPALPLKLGNMATICGPEARAA